MIWEALGSIPGISKEDHPLGDVATQSHHVGDACLADVRDALAHRLAGGGDAG